MLPARGVFLHLRSNLCPLHWQVDSYPLYHQGSPYPYCLDYWSFAVEIEIWRFEIEKCEFRRFFFFNIDLTIIVLVNFHVNFRASSSVYSKRPAGILIEITLNLRIHLGSLAI